jgi:hypothetical protein
MRPRGIVTACDEHYFAGLLQLHVSVQTSWPCPIACFDVGLTPLQRAEAESKRDLSIIDVPDDPRIEAIQRATLNQAPLAKADKRIWPLWVCPLLIEAAPFRDVFWLDCDILVLRGLDELFARLESGPVFTPENKAPDKTPNPARLYQLLPIARAFDPRYPVVNGGVSGWRKGRDDAALKAYIRPVEAAAHDPDVLNAVAWHDQGALIWAIQSLGLESRVLDSPLWNLCIDHVHLPADIMVWDGGLVDGLRIELPEVRLLHWNGAPQPWKGQ